MPATNNQASLKKRPANPFHLVQSILGEVHRTEGKALYPLTTWMKSFRLQNRPYATHLLTVDTQSWGNDLGSQSRRALQLLLRPLHV